MLDARFDQLPVAHRVNTFESSSRHGAPGTRGRLQVSDGRQGFDNLRFRYERPLLILLFLVGLLLSIACANCLRDCDNLRTKISMSNFWKKSARCSTTNSTS